MSGVSNSVQDQVAEVTESQALALCVQLADDFNFLMEKIQWKYRLSYDTYNSSSFKMAENYMLQLDHNTSNLARSLIRNYRTYADFLRSKKYG